MNLPMQWCSLNAITIKTGSHCMCCGFWVVSDATEAEIRVHVGRANACAESARRVTFAHNSKLRSDECP